MRTHIDRYISMLKSLIQKVSCQIFPKFPNILVIFIVPYMRTSFSLADSISLYVNIDDTDDTHV